MTGWALSTFRVLPQIQLLRILPRRFYYCPHFVQAGSGLPSSGVRTTLPGALRVGSHFLSLIAQSPLSHIHPKPPCRIGTTKINKGASGGLGEPPSQALEARRQSLAVDLPPTAPPTVGDGLIRLCLTVRVPPPVRPSPGTSIAWAPQASRAEFTF